MSQKDKNIEERLFSKDHLKENLRKKSLRGIVTKSVSQAITVILRMGSAIVLARLLAPEHFGLFAMATAFTEFTRAFRELGLGTATVQRENINDEEVNTLFWINVGIGILLTGVIAGVSPVLAWFFNEDRAGDVCLALSVTFLFAGLTVQHRALLERQMNFGYLGIINIISSLLGVGIAFVLAWGGFGVWALVWREIITDLCTFVGMWIMCGWLPGLPRWNTNIRSMIIFGIDITGYNILQQIARSVDRVLLGKFCGATVLGLYSKSFQLLMMPINQVKFTILGVAMSPLSALQNDTDRYRRYYEKLIFSLSLLYMPFVVFVIVNSDAVIRLLLGEKWLPATGIFRILAFAGFFEPVVSTCRLVMISCDKTRKYLKWGGVHGACLIIAFAIGIRWGGVGVATAYAIVTYVILVPSLWYCFRGTPVTVVLFFKSISLPMFSSVTTGVVWMWICGNVLDTNSFEGILATLLIGVLAYAGVLLILPGGTRKIAELLSYTTDIFRREMAKTI